ncbi:hypothetical protein [Ramlibacter sp.]|uniref:hypothetical protein n=1 Tax=Ramlibacter sp. TaxID=1917967 RepID=UPI0017FD7A81|nr:hypothetical protein [Ramlibacter sp.]MBA2675455.1 hypothetical protein [Ramlibacter sp.]
MSNVELEPCSHAGIQVLRQENDRLLEEIRHCETLLSHLRAMNTGLRLSDRERAMQLEYAIQNGISRRRARVLLVASWSTAQKSRAAGPPDAVLRNAIHRLRGENPGFGIRRIRELLANSGIRASKCRCESIWKECIRAERQRAQELDAPPGRARPSPGRSARQPAGPSLEGCMHLWYSPPRAGCEQEAP